MSPARPAAIRRDNFALVPCRSCLGTGKRHLTDIQRNTLASIDNIWTTTATILDNLGAEIGGSALVNRLNGLVALGLVERRRIGAATEWRRL